jgi:hypothetical protein
VPRALRWGWFAHPEHPEPGQEHGSKGYEPEGRGTTHALKEHAARDQHADGQDTSDQVQRGIRLTALGGREEIA